MNTMRLVEAFWQDLRFGMRLLLKNPTFSIVAILTLALGTGANAAIFQLVNSLRLRPLPVERPHELVAVGIETNGTGRTGRFMSRRARFTEPQWRALEAEQRVFSDILAWGLRRGTWRPTVSTSLRAASTSAAASSRRWA
jgi:putative ABC transport system permease protein